MFIWVALKENAKQAKYIEDNYRNMFESRMSGGGKEDYLIQRNLKQTFPDGPMTWKVMQRNAWKDIANMQTQRLNNHTQS